MSLLRIKNNKVISNSLFFITSFLLFSIFLYKKHFFISNSTKVAFFILVSFFSFLNLVFSFFKNKISFTFLNKHLKKGLLLILILSFKLFFYNQIFVLEILDCIKIFILDLLILILIENKITSLFLNKKKQKDYDNLFIEKELIQPHTIINLLNNIYYLVEKNKKTTQEFIINSSNLLQYFLYDAKKTFNTIEKEIELIKNYIKLQKIMKGKYVDVSFVYPYDKNVKVPVLIIFPLVENCFKHGIDMTKNNNVISIEIIIKESVLTIKTTNSFISSTKYLKNKNEREKTGLKNIKKRLDILYNKNYKFLSTSENNIYKIKLEIPLSTKNETE